MRKDWILLPLGIGALCSACGSDNAQDASEPDLPAQADASDDTPAEPEVPDDAAIDLADDAQEVREVLPDAPPIEPESFRRVAVPTEEIPAPDGYRWARAIVHMHSTHSHDACDDVPRLEDGSYNDACVSSLRKALCDVRVDVAYQTDHPTHMAEVPFEDLLHIRDGDRPIVGEDDVPIANRIPCDNGHEVLLRAGAEDALMPLGMTGHVPGTPEERDHLMNEYTREAAETMREAGALVWVAHTEEKTFEDLERIGVDGMEVYQLHANLDPRSRTEHLGLDAVGPIADLFPLLAGTTRMHADIAFLGFVEDNAPSLARWAEVLQVRHVVGTAGTDTHENTFPEEMPDGERLDSYRRMMSWFSNQLLIEGELTMESAHEALRAGRVLIVFDLFGSPAGADFHMHDGVRRFEMGETLDFVEGLELRGDVPIPMLDTGEVGVVSGQILRAQGSEWVEVAQLGAGPFVHVIDEPGPYRVEIRTTGAHFAPYLDVSPQFAERDVPWLMTNAWRLR